MTDLRAILDQATRELPPGGVSQEEQDAFWAAFRAKDDAEIFLEALAPDLAALVLDIVDLLAPSFNYIDDELGGELTKWQARLAALDQSIA